LRTKDTSFTKNKFTKQIHWNSQTLNMKKKKKIDLKQKLQIAIKYNLLLLVIEKPKTHSSLYESHHQPPQETFNHNTENSNIFIAHFRSSYYIFTVCPFAHLHHFLLLWVVMMSLSIEGLSHRFFLCHWSRKISKTVFFIVVGIHNFHLLTLKNLRCKLSRLLLK
jgi:hypothetical protein